VWFTYCDDRERDSDRKYHIQMLVHWLFFSGVSYCDYSEHAFIFAYDTQEKEHQNTRHSDLYSGAMPLHTNQIARLFDVLYYYM
jgi:hypothetical protein